MNIKQWLNLERGRHTELAAHLNVSVGRISQMATDGVPPKYMLSVRDFTNSAVSLESMVGARTPKATLVDSTLEAQMAKAKLIERRETVRRADDRATLKALKGQGA